MSWTSRICLTSFLVCASLTEAPAAPIETHATAGFAVRYDDNIYQYSDRNLARFGTGAKFTGLDSTSDVIAMPSLDVRAIRKGRYPTRFTAGVDLNSYLRNSVKNYQAYAVGLSQRIAPRIDISLRYRTIPSFFVGRLADPPNQPTVYSPAEFGLQTWRLALDAAPTRRLDAQVFTVWESKDYRAAFDERDLTVRGGGVSATARLARRVGARVGLEAERGHAAGADAPLTALASDGSYRETKVSIRPTITVAPHVEVAPQYARAWRRYTSSLGAADRNYSGRKDQTDALGLDVTVKVAAATGVRLEYDRINRRSNKSGTDLEFADYTEQRMTLGAEYRF